MKILSPTGNSLSRVIKVIRFLGLQASLCVFIPAVVESQGHEVLAEMLFILIWK
jgi:hypothetical protein